MATGNVPITAGSGTPIRVVTNTSVDSGANQQVFSLADAAGNLLGTTAAPIPVEDFDFAATISIAANATSSGAITGLNNAAVAAVQLTGTFVATVQTQVTVDGSTWVNITGSNSIMNVSTGAYVASGNLTTAGIYQVELSGFVGVRVITTAYTSGTVTGSVRVTGAAGFVSIEGVPTVTLGAGTITNVLGRVQLFDGTNGSSIKGSSTAATATDLALVVAPSPNSVGPVAIGAVTASRFGTVTTAAALNLVVKATAGYLQELTVSNPTSTAAYVKLYDAASVTVGAGTPVATYRLAATGSAGDTISPYLGPNGKRHATGIVVVITAAAAATDTAATVAGIQVSGTYV